MGRIGQIAWNKGLTKYSNSVVARIGKLNSIRLLGKKGRKITEEEKKKTGDRFRNRILTEEHKNKISISLKGRFCGEKCPAWNFDREQVRKNKIVGNMSRRILHRTMKYFGTKKEKSTFEELGYSASDLKNHIQSQFHDGMSWENYGVCKGQWSIDHIKPICEFQVSTPIHIINALENLRPLWHDENIRRSRKSLKRSRK